MNDNTSELTINEIAAEEKNIDAILGDLDKISAIFEEHPELKTIFEDSSVSIDKKKDMAKNILEGYVEKETLIFILILISRGRIGSWDGIVKNYRMLFDQDSETSRGIVYSVLPVEGENLRKLEEETARILDRKVKLENRIDTTLIGGAVIYVDGKLIDISIRKKLNDLKQAMLR